MNQERQIRMEAKSRLKNKNNWTTAITIVLMSMFLNFFINLFIQKRCQMTFVSIYLKIICSIVVLIFLLVFNLGVKRWFYRVSIGDSPTVSEIFYYFRSSELICRALASVVIKIRIFIIYFLFVLPSVVLMFFSAFKMHTDLRNSNLWLEVMLLSFFLIIISEVPAFLFTTRYFLAEYFIVSDDYVSVQESIKFSVDASKGNRLSIFKLCMSFWVPIFLLIFFMIYFILYTVFILPYFLCTLILLSMLYIVPYCSTSLAVCAKWLIEKHYS